MSAGAVIWALLVVAYAWSVRTIARMHAQPEEPRSAPDVHIEIPPSTAPGVRGMTS